METFEGYGDAIVGTVEGLWQMASDPVGTVEGLYYAATHPGETWNAICTKCSTLAQSDRGRGQIFGEVLITIATMGAGAVAKSGKLAQVSRAISGAAGKAKPVLQRLALGEAGFVSWGSRAEGVIGKIGTYNSLRPVTTGTGLIRHHLIEKRFAAILEQKPGNMLSVALDKTTHQAFTNAWYAEIRYGAGTASTTQESVIAAARKIYADYPEYLTTLGL